MPLENQGHGWSARALSSREILKMPGKIEFIGLDRHKLIVAEAPDGASLTIVDTFNGERMSIALSCVGAEGVENALRFCRAIAGRSLRECVICGFQWRGRETDTCPITNQHPEVLR